MKTKLLYLNLFLALFFLSGSVFGGEKKSAHEIQEIGNVIAEKRTFYVDGAKLLENMRPYSTHGLKSIIKVIEGDEETISLQKIKLEIPTTQDVDLEASVSTDGKGYQLTCTPHDLMKVLTPSRVACEVAVKEASKTLDGQPISETFFKVKKVE